jgi:DNA-binding NarL/FixJ family response regulator
LTDKILTAIRKTSSGDMYVSEELASKLIQKVSRKESFDSQSDYTVLSDRELDVFRLIGQGLTTKQIADELHLSVKTIETHRTRIKDKLSIKSTNELMIKAFDWVRQENLF